MECEKINIVYDASIEKNLLRSRRALGQIALPERLHDDPVQIVKQEDFEAGGAIKEASTTNQADIGELNVGKIKAEV